MTQETKRQLAIEACAQLQKAMLDLVDPRTCLNCVHFTERTEECSKYKQRPPARVIANACPAWKQDLPF